MKKRRKRTYFQCFRKWFGIMTLVWLLVFYVFLQIAYFVVYSKVEQKTSIKFYEGMEAIQYLIKDEPLENTRPDLSLLLASMSSAGNAYDGQLQFPLGFYLGNIIGIRLDKFEHFFLMSSGLSSDGEGNTYLGGQGRGWGYVQDVETEEIVCESVMNSNWTILYLKNMESQIASSDVLGSLKYAKGYYCDVRKLRSVLEELDQSYNEKMKELTETDPEYGNRRMKWQIDSFYEKGSEIYPAKVSLIYYDARDVRKVRGKDRFPDEVLLEKSFRPDSYEGYLLHQVDQEKETVIATILSYHTEDYGIPSNDIYGFPKWKADDAFRMEAKNAIKSMRIKSRSSDVGEGKSIGNPALYFLNGKMVFMRSAYFQDGTGHYYRVCTYQTISDLFRGNFGFIFWWGIWFFLVFTILAGMIAYVTYLKNRHVFMTKEYRNVLMDSMAHDLKSPLMAASGYADSLREHVNDEKRDHYAEQIQKSVKYMNEIVMKNLEILKYDKEHKKCIRKEVNVRKLFEEVLDRYQDELEANELKVSREGELIAKGDEELLQKVAENLITNCIRYTPKGGSVRINFEKRGFSVQNETEIAYTGSLKHLWEPFVRGDESRTGKGTGLGLAIVANVLDRHSWKYKLNYDKETKTFTCMVKIPWGILF